MTTWTTVEPSAELAQRYRNRGWWDGETLATLLGDAGHEILGRPDPGWNPGRYVPSTARIRQDLGVVATVPLAEAIRRTAIWNGWTR